MTPRKTLQIQRLADTDLAEREGFEPPLGCPKPDFESGAFDHSAISPERRIIADARAAAARALAIVMLALAAGCATVPPGQDYPREVSAALANPETTTLGRKLEPRAQAHPGLSAFGLIPRGNDGFVLRAQMAAAAEKTIDAQYFVFQNDDTGQFLLDALLRAANRGVRVRLLIDDTEAQGQDQRIAALAAHPNVDVRMFNPFWSRGGIPGVRQLEFVLGSARLNHRMHNKLFVIDNEIALAGGRNVGDEYFDTGKQLQFGDYDVFIIGPSVRKLSQSFDDYWNHMLAVPAAALWGTPTTERDLAEFERELRANRAEMKGSELERRVASGALLAELLDDQKKLVWARAEVIYDPPDKGAVTRGDRTGVLLSERLLTAASETRSELTIVTPYFVPGANGEKLLHDLRARGARVRILTNSLASTDVPLVHTGYMRYRVPLLEDGVEIYEVRPVPGLPERRGSGAPSAGPFALHAKVYVFDRTRLFVGSANFDRRSFRLNTEVGLLIDSPELSRQVLSRFESIAQPANSYVLALAPNGNPLQRLVWRTEEDGKLVEYTVEPGKDILRKIGTDVLALLPLEEQL
jgi:cardiolipin synthase C